MIAGARAHAACPYTIDACGLNRSDADGSRPGTPQRSSFPGRSGQLACFASRRPLPQLRGERGKRMVIAAGSIDALHRQGVTCRLFCLAHVMAADQSWAEQYP